MALLVGFSANAECRWWHGVGDGVMYGILSGLVVYLAKGGWRSGDAPYVLTSATVTVASSAP